MRVVLWQPEDLIFSEIRNTVACHRRPSPRSAPVRSTLPIMLTAIGLHGIRLHRRVSGSLASLNFQRGYAAKRRPKTLAESTVSNENWAAFMTGAVAMQETLSRTDKRPLQKLFDEQGLIAPIEKNPLAIPAGTKAGAKKVKKVKLASGRKLKRTKTEAPKADEPLARWERAEFINEARRRRIKPTASYDDALAASQQAIGNQERLYKERVANKHVPHYWRESAEHDKDPEADEALVDDPTLVSNWKKTVDKKVKLLKKKRLQKVSSTSKSADKPKTTKKASSSATEETTTTTKSASQGKTKAKPKKSFESWAGQFDPDQRAAASSMEQPTASQANGSGGEDVLTFLEGSEEDLANFGMDVEEVPGELARTNRMARPHLRKKSMHVPSKYHMKGNPGPADEKSYMESVQKQDDAATKAYVDRYDSDLVSQPPIALRTFPAKFWDSKGASDAILDTMGDFLSFKTRGIRFDGIDTHDWTVREPMISQDVAETKFKFHMPQEGVKMEDTGSTGFGWAGRTPLLDDANLEFDMPIKIATTQNDPSLPPLLADASIHIKTSHHKDWNSFAIYLQLPDGSTLHPTSLSIDPRGQPTPFDEQIKQIQLQLPAKSFLKTCWNCALSQYSPIAKPVFGGLACFRHWPNIETVRDKMELLRNWNKHADSVQETHVCDSFKRRTRPRIEGFNSPPPKNPEGIKQRTQEEAERKKSN